MSDVDDARRRVLKKGKEIRTRDCKRSERDIARDQNEILQEIRTRDCKLKADKINYD